MIVTHETYENGVLVDSREVEVPDPPAPEAVNPATVIESVAAMTNDQKAALRAALGL